MHHLGPPDIHHVHAVHGWLELGNSREARAELARLSAAARGHPEALEARWRVCAADHEWEQALSVAADMVAADPEDPTGWVDQSYALHELKRTAEARALLLPTALRFPETSVIPYNLACYACQLGDLEDARRWLERAVTLRSRADLRRLALNDHDLKPLWNEILDW
jgi:Flp pilus assembly protein TadD